MTRQIPILILALMVAAPAMAIQVVGDPDVQINGKLGIGTAAPGAPLHLVRNDSSTVQQSFRVEQSGTGDAQMSFVLTGVYGWSMGVDNSDGDRFKINRGTSPGALNDLTLNNMGFLGIGTNDPKKVLHVEANTNGNHDLWVRNTGTGTAGLFLTANGDQASYKFYSFGTSLGIWDINAAANRWVITSNGNMGVGTSTPSTKLDVNGEATVKVLNITGGSDLSESFKASHPQKQEIEPGMILSIDPANPGELLVSTEPYDRKVAGIVSGAGGLETGLVMGQQGTLAHGKYPVALTGRVYCLADATQGTIEPGDMLTTSSIPGHAMKVRDHDAATGAVIGKAMTGLDNGTGMVLVLVSLQ
jgi:hypothetical protein